ncbi:hypothetical protein [Paenibacillus alkalitolerans]|uniref:hypothetical protein n=1 Tax=Paenibacillus alkalitolerans TaxID=2799335 RepID=UPI0018F64D61|nr:hypothetical protein [Paenibacillus alkalitolerans]
MNREDYLQAKETGMTADVQEDVQPDVQDAAVLEETEEMLDVADEIESEASNVDSETQEEEEDIELPEAQKTAFQKALEREKRKIREQAEQEYESKYGKHKAVIDLMGGDPEKIEKAIRDSKMLQEAQQYATQYGWNEEQTRQYMEQRKRDNELQELRVEVKINSLGSNPQFQGIGSMKQAIINKINEYGGKMSVEEAYWAVGGPRLVEQRAMEERQRAAAKRSGQQRTVQGDSPTSSATPKPLPADIESQRRKLGISEREARELWEKGTPGNLEEYRKMKKKA